MNALTASAEATYWVNVWTPADGEPRGSWQPTHTKPISLERAQATAFEERKAGNRVRVIDAETGAEVGAPVRRFQIGKRAFFFHHDETRAVLAGAYRGRDISRRALLTHTVFVDSKGDDVGVGCRQLLDNMADHFSGDAESRDAAPTCPTCLKVWHALDSARALKGAS